MHESKLWIASIKAKVLENCELESDGSEFQFVECLFFTDSGEKLVSEINKTLPAMRLELIDILECKIYRSEDWKGDSDPLVEEFIEEAADEAKLTKQLVFGPFTSSNFLK